MFYASFSSLSSSCLCICVFVRVHCYLGRYFKSGWDVTEPSTGAVLPRPVVLVPVAVATSHRSNYGNMKQEDEEQGEEELLHCGKDPQLLKVGVCSHERRN